MLKPWIVHYKNKYPNCEVQGDDDTMDIIVDGKVRVALRRNGAGQWVDCSAELGAPDRHCLEPLPKACRFMKLYKDGTIGKSEEFDDRFPIANKIAGQFGGRVPSEIQLVKFDKERKEEEAKKASAPKQLPQSPVMESEAVEAFIRDVTPVQA